MNYFATAQLTLFTIFSLLTFNACSDKTQGNNTWGEQGSIDFQSTLAFNTYDNSTFADSACTPLPITVPEGVFVAVNGKSSATGTLEDPLDLQTALSSASSPIQAGETIWLKEGLYTGTYTCDLRGEENAPISIRPLPGKRAVINSHGGSGSAALTMDTHAQWCDIYGLEFTSTDKNRGSTTEASPHVNAKTGLTILGPNINTYNTVVYDNIGSGIDFWKTAVDSTLHGNIIYNNGHAAKGRGHGHGIYTQNTTGYKNISNNIIFFGYQTGLHPYSTAIAPLNNFNIENNVWFLAGASDPRDSQQKTNLIIQTKSGIDNLQLTSNKGYSQVNRGSSLNSIDDNGSVVFRDNYLVERLELYNNWIQMDFVDNTIYGNIDGDATDKLNDISGNVFESSRPSSGVKIFVDANTIDPRRGRIVIYNYADESNVSIDLSSILQNGEAYQVHSIFGLFEAPLLSGIYDGSSISIPMGTVSPPQPNGEPNGIDADDGPKKKFGVFIVTHAGCI